MFSVEELGQEIASLSAHLDAATHRLLTCIRQFDEQCGWGEQGAVSCAHWLAWRVGLDAATAREKVRVARALGKLPAIDEALRVGKLSYAKVRALTRVATAENEARLPEDTAPKYMIRDRDGIYGDDFCRRVGNMGIEEVLTAPRSPARGNNRTKPRRGDLIEREGSRWFS